MKCRILVIWSLVFFLLPAPLRMEAQNVFENTVSFDKVVHNFGDILLSDGEMECTFRMKNVGKQPVVIHRVLTSCGCTEPSWTKAPIRPGETGEIHIVFSNDQGPYPFSKSITVYVSGLGKPVILKVQGVAHDKEKSLKELFPVLCGPVGFRDRVYSMGQIEQGLSRTVDIEIANVSGHQVKLGFRDLTPGLTVRMDRESIAPRSKARIWLTVNTSETSGEKWGKTGFSYTLLVDGQPYRQPMRVEALIKENFTTLTEAQKRMASLPQFEKSSAELGLVEEGQPLEAVFRFKNIGKEPFTIYKADASEKGVKVESDGEVRSGEHGEVRIRIDTRGQKGEMLNILTLITNSPTRPIINLFLIYTVK